MRLRRMMTALLIGGVMSLAGCTASPSLRAPVEPAPPGDVPAEGAARPSLRWQEQPAYWPTDGWRSSTPEEQGLDSGPILEMLQEIEQAGLGLHSLLVIRHGYLVTEVYFPPYQQELPHPVFSISKSVTSALAGIAIEEGYLDGVDQKVLDFFPEIAGDRKQAGEHLRALTIKHLLTMSAGYGANTMPNLEDKGADFDAVNYILTRSSPARPPAAGSSFYYDSGGPHLLSAIIQRATGRTLQEYARQKLFEPLGIGEVSWAADPQGITLGNTGLKLRPRDMAKLGYLYLHNGRWDGAQLLPAEWVAQSTSWQIDTKGLMKAGEDTGYGYLWWIDPDGGYSAHGFGGQYIFVLPGLDMVVVFTGGLKDSDFPVPGQLVRSYLVPAARSALPYRPSPANAQRLQALHSYISSIELSEKPAAPLPPIARQISGKTFRLAPGSPEGMFKTVSLTFADETLYKSETFWPAGEHVVVLGGLNNIFCLSQVRLNGPRPRPIVVALRGSWLDDSTFSEEFIGDVGSDVETIRHTYTFSGKKVTIEASSSMGFFAVQAVGEME